MAHTGCCLEGKEEEEESSLSDVLRPSSPYHTCSAVLALERASFAAACAAAKAFPSMMLFPLPFTGMLA
jgi:hypothetical protein